MHYSTRTHKAPQPRPGSSSSQQINSACLTHTHKPSSEEAGKVPQCMGAGGAALHSTDPNPMGDDQINRYHQCVNKAAATSLRMEPAGCWGTHPTSNPSWTIREWKCPHTRLPCPNSCLIMDSQNNRELPNMPVLEAALPETYLDSRWRGVP